MRRLLPVIRLTPNVNRQAEEATTLSTRMMEKATRKQVTTCANGICAAVNHLNSPWPGTLQAWLMNRGARSVRYTVSDMVGHAAGLLTGMDSKIKAGESPAFRHIISLGRQIDLETIVGVR